MVKEAEMVIVGQVELPHVSKEECLGVLIARAEKVLSGRKGEAVIVDDLTARDGSINFSDRIVKLPDGWKQMPRAMIREAFPDFAAQLGVDLKSNSLPEIGKKQWYMQSEYFAETRRYTTTHPGVELVRTDLFDGEELWEQEWKLVNNNFVPPKATLRQKAREVLFGVEED